MPDDVETGGGGFRHGGAAFLQDYLEEKAAVHIWPPLPAPIGGVAAATGSRRRHAYSYA
jgi:hypothetical protein